MLRQVDWSDSTIRKTKVNSTQSKHIKITRTYLICYLRFCNLRGTLKAYHVSHHQFLGSSFKCTLGRIQDENSMPSNQNNVWNIGKSKKSFGFIYRIPNLFAIMPEKKHVLSLFCGDPLVSLFWNAWRQAELMMDPTKIIQPSSRREKRVENVRASLPTDRRAFDHCPAPRDKDLTGEGMKSWKAVLSYPISNQIYSREAMPVPLKVQAKIPFTTRWFLSGLVHHHVPAFFSFTCWSSATNTARFDKTQKRVNESMLG